MERTYEEMKPVKGEAKYVDFDSEFDSWAVFGEDSGFCFFQGTRKACESYLQKTIPADIA